MIAETHRLAYGDKLIEFCLVRRDRKTLSITVTPEMETEVVAPLDAPLEKVFEKVRKRAAWITKQQQFFDQFNPRTPERRYIPGETHRYLGRQYVLKVVPHIQKDVKLYRGRLVVQSLRPKQAEETKQLVQDWFLERARIKYRERLEVCRNRFPDADAFTPTSLIIRHLAQRWGSMTPSGKLILNKSLIRASVDAIDYVITHELCHLQHLHHGPEFYNLLSRVMPDWEKRKLKLERQMV